MLPPGTLLLAATILFALWYLPVRSVQMGTPRFSSPYFMEVSAAALFLFAGEMRLALGWVAGCNGSGVGGWVYWCRGRLALGWAGLGVTLCVFPSRPGAMMLFESFQAEAPRVRVGAVATRIPGYSLHERPRRQGPPLWSLP